MITQGTRRKLQPLNLLRDRATLLPVPTTSVLQTLARKSYGWLAQTTQLTKTS